VFDRDRDGRITAEEVMDVLLKLGERCSIEECRKMVKEIDRNHDGFVDMDDFMAMMTRPRKRA
jgi:calcium-binding protein CML